jgi:hypothetical protein
MFNLSMIQTIILTQVTQIISNKNKGKKLKFLIKMEETVALSLEWEQKPTNLKQENSLEQRELKLLREKALREALTLEMRAVNSLHNTSKHTQTNLRSINQIRLANRKSKK